MFFEESKRYPVHQKLALERLIMDLKLPSKLEGQANSKGKISANSRTDKIQRLDSTSRVLSTLPKTRELE